jgi:hypothetical protein
MHLAALDTAAGLAPAPIEAARDPRAVWSIAKSAIHARVLAGASQGTRAPPPPPDALLVGEAGAWFRPPNGARVGLERRKSLALLLDRLASERLARPGATLAGGALFAAAWPGEKAIASAASHRVRVAVATLRKMGLRDLLVTQADGYALDANVGVVRA